MTDFDWENRIREWSRKRIEALDDYKKKELLPEILESGYFGCPSATEEQIAATEARLGVTFPSSYREFLKASNGLRSASEYGLYFYSADDIDWYAFNEQVWIDECVKDWQEPVTDEEYFVYDENQNDVFRPEYLQTALEISSQENGYIFLLNPQITIVDNEWEAWHCSFSTAWGVYRYRSFGEMMSVILSDPKSIW